MKQPAENRKPYLIRPDGAEIWVRLLKVDYEALRYAGYQLVLDERDEGIYITIEP